MQHAPEKREARYSAWAYFLGMGFALGTGGVGTLLSVLLHNPALGFSAGAIIGLLLGLLGLKFFGHLWVERVQRNLSRNTTQPRVRKPLPFGFFIGEGAALGLAAIGVPLGVIMHNMAAGLGIGLATGLVVGIIIGQLVRINRNR